MNAKFAIELSKSIANECLAMVTADSAIDSNVQYADEVVTILQKVCSLEIQPVPDDVRILVDQDIAGFKMLYTDYGNLENPEPPYKYLFQIENLLLVYYESFIFKTKILSYMHINGIAVNDPRILIGNRIARQLKCQQWNIALIHKLSSELKSMLPNPFNDSTHNPHPFELSVFNLSWATDGIEEYLRSQKRG